MKNSKPKAKIRAAKLGKNGDSSHKWLSLKSFFRWELIIVFGALVCDVNSWGHQFVFDDTIYIVENHFIQAPQNIFRIFVSPLVPVQLGAGHLYRPLTAFSLGLNWWIDGSNPDGFHLVNRFCHVLICLGIFWVLRRLLSNIPAAFLTALLFAVHPIQTEAVTYIDGRSDVLAMLFFIFAWFSHIRARESDEASGKYFAAAFVFYLFSMMSKESGITWIAVVLLTEYIYFSKSSLASLLQSLQKGLWKVWVGYLAAAAVFLSLRAYALSKVLIEPTSYVDNPLGHVSFLVRELTALKVLFQSLGLLLWPLPLSSDYSYNQIPLITTWSSFAGLGVIAGSVVLLILLGWSHNRARNVFFGLGYFLATYSIISNLVIPIGTIRADRLLYMPSLGVFLVGGTLLAAFDRQLQQSRVRMAFRAGVVIVLILLSVRTILRNGDWRDAMTLSAKTVQTSPNSTKAHYSLGSNYFAQGKYILAAEQYRIAESIYSKNSALLLSIGIVHNQMGNTDDAIRYFHQALELASQSPIIHFHLSRALRARGDLAGAKLHEDAVIAFYDDLIRKDPSNADHHFFKGNALFHLGQYEQALIEYRLTLQLDPNYNAAKKGIDLTINKLKSPG